MDATSALDATDKIVTDLIGNLTPAHKDMATPCTEWTVHDLIDHMCGGAQMIAGGLQGQAPPTDAPDLLANGPAEGWATAIAALREAATPEALASKHQMPFGEVPGEVTLSVIVADHLTHAWDLAKATEQPLQVDDDLATWALATWQMVVPAEGRDGGGFADVVPVSDGASSLDKLAGYTGRTP